MREIEFRAKLQGHKEWIYGLPNQVYRKNGIDSIHDLESNVVEYIRTDTLGQFTGIKDLNKTKIFEGDIVKNKYGGIGVVEYDEECCAYKICYSDEEHFFEDDDIFEVIGNKFENPELLQNND